jgi:hypothetical protein
LNFLYTSFHCYSQTALYVLSFHQPGNTCLTLYSSTLMQCFHKH